MWKFIFLLFFFANLSFASPDINVGSLYDYMSHEKNIAIKKIYNFGNDTAFVKVSIHEIVYDEQGRPIEKELAGDGKRELVASPSHMIIPTDGMQVIRFIYLGGRDKERYFRIRFIPVLPEEVTIDSDEVKSNQIQTGLNILTGFGTILFIPPGSVNYSTKILKENGAVYIENNGNTTVVIDNLERCDKKNEHCTQAEKLHVLPGVKREISYDGYSYPLISFDLIEGSKSTFNRVNL